jgi:hypothetical protein
MILRMKSPCSSFSRVNLQILIAPGDNPGDEAEQIGALVNTWLGAQEKPRPNARFVRREERKLHEAIKNSSLRGKILTFAGLNLWVDDGTPDGVVESQEAINL